MAAKLSWFTVIFHTLSDLLKYNLMQCSHHECGLRKDKKKNLNKF